MCQKGHNRNIRWKVFWFLNKGDNSGNLADTDKIYYLFPYKTIYTRV